ncbi:nucleotidyltransferase family protein [Patescibacteria group bacterium]|nr:nucleotidyltransferase family protein [Patescibacteria group bacterium]
MKAILLTGGEGLRMRPLTENKPKPLIEINGWPLISHIAEKMPDKVTEFVIIVGYLGEQVRDYCGREFFGRPVTYTEQKEMKGTFHALETCRDLLKRDETFMVFYGDDLIDKKTAKELSNENLAVAVSLSEHPERFGVVEKNADNTVKRIVEKPDKFISDLVLSNGLTLNGKIFDYKPEPKNGGQYYISEAISKMVLDGYKFKIIEASFWIPLATPEDLKNVEKMIA